MKWFKQLLSRRRLYGELSEEIREHLEEKILELVAGGMPRKEAVGAARREFGNVTLVEQDSHEVWRWPCVENYLADIRYGLRALRKSPGFTSIVVLTLALGIGTTTTVFSVVKAVILNPLPYQNAERLAVLWTDNAKQNLHEERTSYPNYEDWRKQATTFADMAFCSAFTVNLTAGDEPERIVAGRSSANFFALMGVEPILGRAFTNEEEERGERAAG